MFLQTPALTGQVPVSASDGSIQAELFAWVDAWTCADARLDALVLAPEAFSTPQAEASEPVAGAIARLARLAQNVGGVLAIRNPSTALGADRVALAQGVRLFGIGCAQDEACWDAALSAGLPVYGVRDQLRIDVSQARRRDAGAVLLSLAYGLFTCGDGLQPEQLVEDRGGVAWRFAETVATAVMVKGGFEADRINADHGSWRDRGSEGYVRLVAEAGERRCWTQPRLVMPGATHG